MRLWSRPGINLLLHLDAYSSAEIMDRFREACSSDSRQKGEDVSAGAAAETMKKLPTRTDRERRTLFLVERAQTFQILSCAGQTDMLADDVYDIDPVLDPIDQVLRNQASAHGRRSSSPPPRPVGRFT
jgi:hypothetical protein